MICSILLFILLVSEVTSILLRISLESRSYQEKLDQATSIMFALDIKP